MSRKARRIELENALADVVVSHMHDFAPHFHVPLSVRYAIAKEAIETVEAGGEFQLLRKLAASRGRYIEALETHFCDDGVPIEVTQIMDRLNAEAGE